MTPKEKTEETDKEFIQPEPLREQMLLDAVQKHASDIHLEPLEEEMLIRFRIDGVLTPWAKRPIAEHDNLISHLKVLCSLDITQHTVPQEGHFLWIASQSKIEKKATPISGWGSPPKLVNEQEKPRVLNIRASFFPTVYGETAVLRLLNREDLLISLDKLELGKDNLKLVRRLITCPFGMVLVSGPAGSGKTTALYSILNELANETKNIITLEDPIEYYLPNVRQSQINPEREYTFALGIRSVLRQDPDIIMVGEIRDLETAENAVRASLTGRLLLSTLHAANAVGTISRLLDMKIEKGILAYALSGVINKRLVRKICEKCREPYTPALSVVKALGLNLNSGPFFHGRGCKECGGQGFYGRIGLFEVLEIDEEIRRMIIDGLPTPVIEDAAKTKGFRTLREDGITKIHAGLTTPEEVLKSAV